MAHAVQQRHDRRVRPDRRRDRLDRRIEVVGLAGQQHEVVRPAFAALRTVFTFWVMSPLVLLITSPSRCERLAAAPGARGTSRRRRSDAAGRRHSRRSRRRRGSGSSLQSSALRAAPHRSADGRRRSAGWARRCRALRARASMSPTICLPSTAPPFSMSPRIEATRLAALLRQAALIAADDLVARRIALGRRDLAALLEDLGHDRLAVLGRHDVADRAAHRRAHRGDRAQHDPLVPEILVDVGD